MSLLIVSDLHISGADDPLYFSLLLILRERAVAGDIVVLAGDLFDLFIGNKPIFIQRYSDLFAALSEAGKKGVEIHYIEGNHDFLIASAFRGIIGLTVHSHDVNIEIEGKRFYLAHGDTVDSRDYAYLLMRAFFRSLWMKAWIGLTPGKYLDKIGHSMSRKSRRKKPVSSSSLPLHRREYLRRTYRSYAAERLAQGYDFVILGHCHDLDEMYFNIGDRLGQYINVGYPRVHGSFLSWTPGDEKVQREKLPE